MSSDHPWRDVAIVGIHNTQQARRLEGHDSLSIVIDAALGAIADAGIDPHDVDGVVGAQTAELVHLLKLAPASRVPAVLGIPTVLQAASMVATGQCHTVLVTAGDAGVYTDRASTAPWTRPTNEFVVSYGLFTAAEFALMARRHMLTYGTTEEQLATVAATIRNNGHLHPGAVYSGRGPFTPADIRASRPIADPFHLLDCSMTSEGGTAMILTTPARAAALPNKPVFILGGGNDSFGPAYQMAPAWDRRGVGEDDTPAGYVGRRAARRAFGLAGLTPSDVDVCEFYDPFSFEIIRQFEAFEFCGEGEGGEFVLGGRIEVGGEFPVTTDGGTMSYSHAGINTQQIQRVARGVEQLRGTCASQQVVGAEVAMCSNGGSGALFNDVILLGVERP